MRSGVRAEMLDAEFLGVFADSGDAGASLAGQGRGFSRDERAPNSVRIPKCVKIVNSRAYIFVKISISFASVFLRLCSFIFQSTNVHLFFLHLF